MTTTNPPPTPPTFDYAELLNLYLQGQHERVCQQFLAIIDYFRANTLYAINGPDQYFLSCFIKLFLFIFTQPDFRVADEFVLRFITLNRTLANMVAISSCGTTDPQLEILVAQQGNYVKLLTLYNARSTVKIDRKALFDTQPELASIWFSEYACIFHNGLANATAVKNMQEHFTFSHPNLRVPREIQETYFGSTYVDGKVDRAIKPIVNRDVRDFLRQMPPIVNRPNPRKIAMASATWVSTHSVYRNYYHYVKALKEKYHLTFFQLGRYGQYETSLFDDVHVLDFANGVPDLGLLRENDFQAFYYPDIGMCAESIILANMRLAPVQFCSPGHSVSTFGADIDYYITGEDSELPVGAEQNYSERLVLLPGMGVIHNKPTYVRRGMKKTVDAFIMNCSWFSHKINYSLLRTMRTIIDRSKRKVLYRMFIGSSTRDANDHLPLCRDVVDILGAENVEIYPGLSYADYMGRMEEADLSIDSFHFGGCNTVSDTLWIGVPIVTWDGTSWYARIGSAMLRLIGMPECIATNEQEYIDIILGMIHEPERLAAARRKVAAANLDDTIYSTKHAGSFTKAVDYIIANHEALKRSADRLPIHIQP